MNTNGNALALGLSSVALMVAGPAWAQRSIEEQAQHRIERADTDGSGTISLAEFQAERLKTAAKKPEWGPEMTDPVRIQRAFGRFDADGNGEVDKAEIVAVLEARANK